MMIPKADKKTRFNLYNNQSTKITLNDIKADIPKYSNSNSLIIDLIANKKRVKGTIEEINNKTIKEKIAELKQMSQYTNTPFFDEFPDTEKQKNSFKTDYTEFDLNEIRKEIIDNIKELKLNKKVKKVISEISIHKGTQKLFSNELEFGNTANELSISIGAIYKDKENSGHSVNKTTIKDYNISKMFSELKNKINLEKNPVQSKEKYSEFILTPQVFAELIDTFIFDNINCEDIILHNNFIAKKIGTKLFDNSLNIQENPFVDNSPHSEKYDSELSRTTKKDIVKNGLINNYFVNLEDSFKYNEKVTGNYFSGMDTTNIIVENGNKSLEKLISETKKGLVIRSIIGLHTSNSKEGSLNVAVNIGNEIINGEITKNVKNIPLSINIVDLFNNIELSKEVEEEENYLLPYLKKDITINDGKGGT